MSFDAQPEVLPTVIAAPVAASFAPDLTTSALVSRCFEVWSKNLFRLAGFFLALILPLALVVGVGVAAGAGMLQAGEESREYAVVVVILTMAVMVPVLVLVMAVQTGGFAFAAVQHLSRRPVRVGAMLGAGFRRSLPALGALVVIGILMMLGLVLLIVPGIIVACGVAVAIPALVVERLGPIEAIQRSWELTQGHRGSIFLSTLLVGFIAAFLNGMVQMVAMIGLGQVGGTIVGLVSQLFFASLQGLLPGVVYYNLRILKEGTPVEELARIFE